LIKIDVEKNITLFEINFVNLKWKKCCFFLPESLIVENLRELLKVIPLVDFPKRAFPTGKTIFSHPRVEK
jgi:hypothetical protein